MHDIKFSTTEAISTVVVFGVALLIVLITVIVIAAKQTKNRKAQKAHEEALMLQIAELKGMISQTNKRAPIVKEKTIVKKTVVKQAPVEKKVVAKKPAAKPAPKLVVPAKKKEVFTAVTKVELVEDIEKRVENTSKAEVNRFVDTFRDLLVEELKKDNRVVLTGFGALGTFKTTARTGRNPQTGEEVSIPSRTKAAMKWSTKVKEYVNK